ncbi:hypothetical protein FPZ54_06500 [Sphingomonas suaedae]|uniref:Uncharacterized protein n=1 Tax=Sphingomonas suaedae TaxID=2599297 RepID=A0A518RE05_9SPHN|nr:hypothetical protein [Sphingomonas suaedae]QDX25705.1 hypothetical protein FPZ54_06500 [Sphingomonas suaedae]
MSDTRRIMGASLAALGLALVGGCTAEGPSAGYGPPPVDPAPVYDARPAAAPPVASGAYRAPSPAPAPAAPASYAAPVPAQSGWQAQAADYYWIDTADGLLEAIGDAPPDFVFDFDRDEAWGWSTETGHLVLAEALGDGSIRYFYYEPDADAPFLVQEARLSFAYARQRLAAVYDSGGAVLSPAEADLHDDLAGDLYARGVAMREAADGEDQWDAVDAGWWAGQIATVVDLRLRWESGRSRHPGWQRWRSGAEAARWRNRLGNERIRRRMDGDRFRDWQRGGFRGPPPAIGVQRPGRPALGVRPPRRDGAGGRPGAGRPGAGRPGAERPEGGRPGAGRPGAGRPEGGRPGPGRPDTGRPDGDRPGTGQPGAGRPGSGRPPVTRPGEGPGAGRPGGARPDAPVGTPPTRPRPPVTTPTPPPVQAQPRPTPRPDRPGVPGGPGQVDPDRRPPGNGLIREREPQRPVVVRPRPPVTRPTPQPPIAQPQPRPPVAQPRPQPRPPVAQPQPPVAQPQPQPQPPVAQPRPQPRPPVMQPRPAPRPPVVQQPRPPIAQPRPQPRPQPQVQPPPRPQPQPQAAPPPRPAPSPSTSTQRPVQRELERPD